MKSYHDIEGDGGSRVAEQVEAQQARIAARLSAVRHVLAIGSGKGGVGKSTLTALLATTLARTGRRIAVLDADLNGPSQARLLGLSAVPLVPWQDGLALPRNREGVGVVSLGTIVPEGTSVEFSEHGTDSHVWRATREFTFLGQLLGSVHWGEQDLLLVDLPPGAERTVQYARFFGREAAFVLVTIPSALARGVVSRSVAALARTPNRVLGYVENMQGYYCADCDEVRPLFPTGAGVELELPCLGHVPFDPQLARSCDAGELALVSAERPAIRAVAEIVRRLDAALEID